MQEDDNDLRNQSKYLGKKRQLDRENENRRRSERVAYRLNMSDMFS